MERNAIRCAVTISLVVVGAFIAGCHGDSATDNKRSNIEDSAAGIELTSAPCDGFEDCSGDSDVTSEVYLPPFDPGAADTSAIIPESSVCGNGVVEAPEVCDDSNNIAGDGCSDTCSQEVEIEFCECIVEDPGTCSLVYNYDDYGVLTDWTVTDDSCTGGAVPTSLPWESGGGCICDFDIVFSGDCLASAQPSVCPNMTGD